MATITELYTIDAMRMDDTARHMSRHGVSLSHRDVEALGTDRIDWLRARLGLVMTSDDSCVHFLPTNAASACFIADAPGAYGASDGRVWSSHATVEEGRRHLAGARRRGERVALHHGSMEPGAHWAAHMETIYPEVK